MTPFASQRQRRHVMAKLHGDTPCRNGAACRFHEATLRGRDLQLVTGDFRTRLPRLRGVRTFFTDPPYNLGFRYGPVKDNLSAKEYEDLMRDFARLSYRAARRNASLFIVHYPERLAELWPVLTEQWRFHSWVTWCYNGVSDMSNRKWTPASRAVLWLTKGKAPEAPSSDWWTIPYVRNVHPESQGYANQIPTELIRRCIKATTRPGDLVADPFAGTGSTVKAAGQLGRRGWGCDANPEAAKHWGYLNANQKPKPGVRGAAAA
jgi:hypothetical protein